MLKRLRLQISTDLRQCNRLNSNQLFTPVPHVYCQGYKMIGSGESLNNKIHKRSRYQ